MLCRVVWQKSTNVSEVLTAAIIRARLKWFMGILSGGEYGDDDISQADDNGDCDKNR
jgi:hypothetical protein